MSAHRTIKLLVGQRFGRLVVLGWSERHRHIVCHCDCGATWKGLWYSLVSGRTKSCGCLRKEITTTYNRSTLRRYDLTGQRFGFLLVMGFVRLTHRGEAVWRCRCDCGIERNITAGHLRGGLTKSCGHAQKEIVRILMTKHGRYKDRDYLSEKDQKRRAILMDAYIETVNPAVVYERDMGLCHLCGLPVEDRDFHLDHRTPLIAGGEHSYANCFTSHASCNYRKGRKMPEDCSFLWARS